MTRKRLAVAVSIGVFAVGLVGIYFLAAAFKDKYSDLTIYAVVMVVFVAFYALAQAVERMIYQPPDKPPFDPSPH